MKDWFFQLVTNPYLITAIGSWAIAQIIKTIVEACINRRFDFWRLFGDGGMPSAHSATVCSLATITAIRLGVGTFEFALAAVFAVVVCRDAVGVRRETGKQAILLQEIGETLEKLTKEPLPEVRLKILVGHTPFQVLMGLCLGIANAVAFHFLLPV